MANVDRVAQVERRGQFGKIVRIWIQVIAFLGLIRAPVPSAIVCDAAVSARCQENHLIFPRVRAKRPAMAEDDRLAFAPIL
jgi:hypothetical protein